ncbi:MAG: ATP-binding protein [Ruminococcus sp.]|nr:ATP-binding protein [Ruminococcus sp.]
MAKILCIMGESGSGKTTSMRNLDPKTTYYVDCDKKGLSWRGWKKQYNKESKNYTVTDDPKTVTEILQMINTRAGHIKVLVIDTVNGIMVADEMRRAKEKGYDKWVDLAACVYYIIDYALTMRDGLTVVFTAHTQTDDNGFTQIKTNGKKLNKIGLESKFPLVLTAKCIDGRFVFETHANKSTAKTPMGMFEENTIDNDISAVISAWDKYDNE